MKRVGMRELLEIAYSIEKNGKSLFLKFALKFKKDEAVVKVFTKLASDEDEHIQRLKEFEKKYYAEGHLFESLYDMEVVKEYFHDFSESNLMKDFKANLGKIKTMKNPVEAVKIGLNLEMDSILFYEKFREMNKHDKDVDKLLCTLIEFETGHVGILYQYLKNFSASAVAS
jgi:rubrerythrin